MQNRAETAQWPKMAIDRVRRVPSQMRSVVSQNQINSLSANELGCVLCPVVLLNLGLRGWIFEKGNAEHLRAI